MEELTINDLLDTLMHDLKQAAPIIRTDRDNLELAQRYAITIAELEKVKAYYMFYIDGQKE